MVPLAVSALLGALLVRRPSRPVLLATVAWALLVVVGGGGSVLPLSVLPFVPEQSVSHYAAHVVYAALQLPLLWVAGRAAWRRGGTDPVPAA